MTDLYSTYERINSVSPRTLLKIVLYSYDSETDTYTCRNGKKLEMDYTRRAKSKTGHISEKTIYKCADCNGCSYKSECIKGNNCKTPMEERIKTLQVAKTFLKQRKEDLKQDMQFRRYLSKGKSNVLAESTLLAMARNINKLHNKIQNERTGTHLFPIKSA